MANIMTVRAPDNLQEKLKQKAKKLGMTRNGLILKILWEWVNYDEKKEQEEGV